MAIDPDYLLTREWPEITHRYTEKDSMLYALGVGLVETRSIRMS